MDANDVAVSSSGWSWTSNPMIALYVAVGVVVAGVVASLLLRKTFRTRIGMDRTLKRDPDINDWLIVFGWTSKILYVPTMAAALLASLLVFVTKIPEGLVGGIWFGLFFLNFLIEEYHINIRLLLISIASIAAFLLWLHLLGWVLPFLRLFTHLAVSISATGYLLITIIGLMTIAVSWVHGLFYYVAITPNSLNLQSGPTEAGEQISREDYNTKVDTGDFFERLLGFGRIIITFKDNSRPPLVLLVWRIDKKAEMLERVRSKFAMDYPQGLRPVPPPPTIAPPPAAPPADVPQDPSAT